MSDTTLNRFVASGTAADMAGFTPTPPTPASGPDPGYFFFQTDTGDTYSWDAGTAAWVQVNTGAGATPGGVSGDLQTNDGSGGFGAITPGTGVATALAANVTGSGGIVLATSPTLVTPALGTPASGTLTNCTFPTALTTRAITFAIDGGGSALTTGVKADVYVPYACTITAVTMLADQSGSCVVDIWKDTLANYPPTNVDTITASAKPTLSSQTNSQDSTLTGWTTSISAGDTLRFNIDSASTLTRLNLTLTVTVS